MTCLLIHHLRLERNKPFRYGLVAIHPMQVSPPGLILREYELKAISATNPTPDIPRKSRRCLAVGSCISDRCSVLKFTLAFLSRKAVETAQERGKAGSSRGTLCDPILVANAQEAFPQSHASEMRY